VRTELNCVGREESASGDRPALSMSRLTVPMEACEQVPSVGVRECLREVTAGAEQEVLAVAAGGSYLCGEMAAAPGWESRSLNRGLTVRTLLCPRARDVLAAADPGLGAAGGRARVSAEVEGYLLVVDRRVAVLPFRLQDPAGAGLLVRAPTIVLALVALFERQWRGAGAPAGHARLVPRQLTVTQRGILCDLASGMTDEAVARKRGMCSRTVRRHITSAMQVFGARSRLELGMRVAVRGLLG
jgi:DNA-binding CsgD family transcriptional regulator